MKNQNRLYFESKKKHKQNVSPKAWLYVIPILVALLSLMFWATQKSNEIDTEKTNIEIQTIGENIKRSKTTQGQTKVILNNLGLSVELHKGLKYHYSDQVKMLTAVSQDSNELAYLIGEVPLYMQKANMKELWIKEVKEKDPNQFFRDSLGKTIVETNQNGKVYSGILTFKEINDTKLVIQSVSLKHRFKTLEPKMDSLIESIKIE